MKLEFSADRVPGPRGSKTEYFLRKPRYRFVAATTSLTGVTFLATTCSDRALAKGNYEETMSSSR
jgi:hypothetical protein